MQKISGHEHPLKKIFSDDFRFEIPPYQRPFSWETEQAKQLFSDLYQHHEDQPKGDNSEPYFLGSLVLKKLDTEALAEVIDGQQRLTTLSIPTNSSRH
jgi:uncharacterized protein with ParB-like and HNH nuclease domain